MEKNRQTAASQSSPLRHGQWEAAKQLPEWITDLWTERLVLGLVLVDPTRAAERLVEIQGVLAADDFSAPRHSLLLKRLKEMRSNGLPLDLVSLVQELDRAGELEAVGGVDCVPSLIDGVPLIADVRFICRNLRRKALLRLAWLRQQVRRP